MAKREKLKPVPAQQEASEPSTIDIKEAEAAKRRPFYAVLCARYLQLIRGSK